MPFCSCNPFESLDTISVLSLALSLSKSLSGEWKRVHSLRLLVQTDAILKALCELPYLW